jgi:hypothetical protein
MNKRILLLASGPNNDKNSSWLVYRKYIDFLKSNVNVKIDVICFSPSIRQSKKSLNEKVLNTFFRDTLITAAVNRFTRNYSWIISRFYARIYWKKVVKTIIINQSEVLWIDYDVLTVLILQKIIKKMDIPYHLTIFDDPFTNKFIKSFQLNYYPVLRYVLAHAKSIDTPTLILAQHYRDTNIIKPNCLIVESLVGAFRNQPKKIQLNRDIVKIVLAGSIYGIDALNKFILAIEEYIISGKVVFHLRSSVPKAYLYYLKSNFPVIFKNIVFMPFINDSDLVEILQQYDLLYLPMLFDENSRFKTNTSFPSKTHNYLASGVPIFLHAPENSSIDTFFKNNNVGYVCNSLDINKIQNAFEELQSLDLRKDLSSRITNFNSKLCSNEHVKHILKVIES